MLTAIHWIYLLFIVIVILFMIFRKHVVFPCLVGLFLIALTFSGSLLAAVQGMFTALFIAGTELFDIMLVIGLMVAMLKSLEAMGADYKMMYPVRGIMKTPGMAFFVIGVVMYLAAIFFWPTPATALVGTLLIPVAIKAGLPAMGAAMAVNIFGHGAALSGDPVIQGALRLSSDAAGVPVEAIFSRALVLSLVAGVVALIIAFIMIQKDIKAAREGKKAEAEEGGLEVGIDDDKLEKKEFGQYAGAFAIGVPIVLLAVIITMVAMEIRGGAATALLGGAAIVLLLAASLLHHGADKAMGKTVDYLREGLIFGIKIFTPVIPIAGFFFLGSPTIAPEILGEGAPGLLFDLGEAFAGAIPLGTIPVAIGILVLGIITGLDGSGFSGLPLTGGMAMALGEPLGIDVASLAALGQMGSIWTGGGTLVAWAFGLVATAGIAGVDPLELARRNFVPVMGGLLAALIVAIIMM